MYIYIYMPVKGSDIFENLFYFSPKDYFTIITSSLDSEDDKIALR